MNPHVSPPERGPLRLCLVHPGAAPFPATWDALRAALRAAGHRVTLASPDARGIDVLDTDRPDAAPARVTPFAPDDLVGAPAERAAYLTYLWLAGEAFDAVIAPSRAAPLFYALLARAQGLDLGSTATVILVDGFTLLDRSRAQEMPRGVEDFARDEMERQSLPLADQLVFVDGTAESWVGDRAWRLGGPACCLPATDDDWRTLLHDAIERRRQAAVPEATEAAELPLVSVCIAHFNRATLLRLAIESVRRQDYPRVELVVVDDASDEPETVQALDAIADDLVRFGGRLVRHPANRYLGAARNTAVAHARGEYVLFLDDDDYAKPDQVSTLVRAALHTGADIVTSLFDRLPGDGPPGPDQPMAGRWLPVGDAPSVGLFTNLFGPATALFRKDSFQALGGFSTLRGVGSEDWELFARACFAGLNLQLVPRALFWYRITPNSMVQTANSHPGNMRGLTPYLERVPAPVRPALCFLQDAGQRLAAAVTRSSEMEKLLATCFTQIAELQAHIAKLEEHISDQQAHIARQEATFAATDAHARALHAALDDAHAHLRARQEALDAAQGALRETQDRNRHLCDELAALRLEASRASVPPEAEAPNGLGSLRRILRPRSAPKR